MKIVWEFTNKRKLTAGEFVKYFEKKVKNTIRKYNMPITSINSTSLNAKVINSILSPLPSRKGSLREESLDDISVSVLCEMIYGKSENLKKFLPKNQPLYFLSEKEILLYGKIKKLKERLREREGKEKEAEDFIRKIEKNNPDVMHNIVNALQSTGIS